MLLLSRVAGGVRWCECISLGNVVTCPGPLPNIYQSPSPSRDNHTPSQPNAHKNTAHSDMSTARYKPTTTQQTGEAEDLDLINLASGQHLYNIGSRAHRAVCQFAMHCIIGMQKQWIMFAPTNPSLQIGIGCSFMGCFSVKCYCLSPT